jgi:hypothetical protein
MKKRFDATPPIRSASGALCDNDLNAVVGGQDKFRYIETNGNTYAVGHVNGQTVKVKVT